MQIVQAVYGVFHHFELAHQLHQRGHLRRIYSTWPWARVKREGLPRALVSTFPYIHTPNYLLQRYYSPSITARLNRWAALTFDEYMRRHIPECDAFIGISGAGLLTGQLVQRRGGIFLCDRGSTHQRNQEKIIREEYGRWNAVPQRLTPDLVIREEAMYQAADAITVPSQVAKRSFVQAGVPADKVHVIPYGVRLGRFKRTQAPSDEFFDVLFAGQVTLRKGIPYLLQAFARLCHPRKRLTVVGSIMEDIRPILPGLPTENVTFTGALPQSELIERMGRSHVLMLPSVEEGLALVQAQAMACECPVIATQATGAEDLFTEGVEGYIVADRDVDALTERLQRIADDPLLQQQLSAAALERVQSVGGWDEYGSRWDNLLHQLTGLPRDPE
jgi:glycosyltransferase involved in cell wall biosynthesis